jgi:hypothetical protein
MLRNGNPVTHERVGRILAGLSLLGPALLAWLWSPWWLLVVAGVGVNLVASGITNRCVVKDLLVRLGLPGERDVGRAEAMLADGGREPAGFRRAISRQRVPVN